MAEQKNEVERRIEESRAALERGDRLAAEAALLAAIHARQDAHTPPTVRAEALMRLGSLQLDDGRLDEAERGLREALAGLTDAVPANAALRASTLAALGQVLVERGDADGARAALTEALTLRETDSGSNDADQVLLLNELSRLCLKQGAYAEAEPLLHRMLVVKRSKGMTHPEVATVLTSLATVRQVVGDLEHAEELHREALGIREQALAPQHFSIAATLEHLADVSAARGKLSDAISFYQRALVIRELTVGSGHPSVQSARERIADLQLQATDTLPDEKRGPVPSYKAAGDPPSPPRIPPRRKHAFAPSPV